MNSRVLSFLPVVIAAVIGALILGFAVLSMSIHYICIANARTGLFELTPMYYESLQLGCFIYIALVGLPVIPFREASAYRLRVAAAFSLPCVVLLSWQGGWISYKLAIFLFWIVASATAYQVWKFRQWRSRPDSVW